MTQTEREQYWIDLEEELLKGGASFSEWCTFLSKDAYTAFVNGADLATVITSLACVETYLKTENPYNKNDSLYVLIDKEESLDDEEKQLLHDLRKFRNKWIHVYSLDDSQILKNEEPFVKEAEKMACLAVKMLMTVLFLNPYV